MSHRVILKRKQIRCHARFQFRRPEIAIAKGLEKALCLPLWQSFPTRGIWPHETFINIWRYFQLSQIRGCGVSYWHLGVESRVAATHSKIQKKAVLQQRIMKFKLPIILKLKSPAIWMKEMKVTRFHCSWWFPYTVIEVTIPLHLR